jgi:predicted dehydrogenase
VIIASPNHTHRAVLDDVLATEVAALVEKPLCTTVPDCLAVVEAASRRSAVTWVGLEYRYMPPVDVLRRTVADGTIGRVRMMAIREHRFPFLRKVGDWNRFNENTGGTLVEKCCHFFDLMNLVVGSRPVRVYASGAQDVNHLDERYEGRTPDILDNAFVTVDYEHGARAMLDLCMFAEAGRNEQDLVVVGDTGKVEAHVPGDGRVFLGQRDGRRMVELPVRESDAAHVGFHHGASFVEVSRFLAAVGSRGAPEVTVVDGLWSVAVGVAAHRSIEEGRPVQMDEVLRVQ